MIEARTAPGGASDPPGTSGHAPPEAVRSGPRVPGGLDYAAGICWRLLVLAATVALAGFVASRLLPIVVPVVIALFVTAALAPAVGWLRARGWAPLPATWAVLVAAAGAVTAIALVVMPQIVNNLGRIGAQLQAAGRDLERWLASGPLHVSPDQLDRHIRGAVDRIGSDALPIFSQILTGASLALEALAGLLVAFVLSFFFVKDGERICAWGLGLLPEGRRDLAARLGRRAFATLGSYVVGSAVLGLAEGLAIGVGLALIGVPLAVPLAVLAFVGAFFPLVGSLASGAVAALVALVNGGPGDALVVVVLVVAVNQADAHILQPLLMGRVLRLHPVAVVIALTTGAVVAGLLGAFLAVPLTAVGAAMVGEVRRSGSSGSQGAGTAASRLPVG